MLQGRVAIPITEQDETIIRFQARELLPTSLLVSPIRLLLVWGSLHLLDLEGARDWGVSGNDQLI